jgi:hypothetical protein
MRLANRRGIRFMVLAMACFIAMTALKILLSSLPDTNVWLLRVLMATQRLTSQVLSSRDTALRGGDATKFSFGERALGHI